MTAMVSLKGVAKSYGAYKVLDPISLEIEDGSFTALLGASGSGKTTLLNLIAGLDQPSAGEIAIAGTTVFAHGAGIDVSTERRNLGYVFQSYALWPHMRVLDNVAYPLRVRGAGRAERHRAAQDMLERLELSSLGQRFPFELSGGQQQRVAIARALVYRPQLLLLDEPLSNLDVQLRERARAWLSKLQSDLKLTTVLVTHDHVEALSLSDRLILLHAGKVEQDGSAEEVYQSPRTTYAADFIGGVNAFNAVVDSVAQTASGSRVTLVMANGARLVLPSADAPRPGTKVKVAVRPRRVGVIASADAAPVGALVLPLETSTSLFQGHDWEVVGVTPIGEIRAVGPRLAKESGAFVAIRPEDCRLLLS